MELPRPPTCPKPQKMRPRSFGGRTATANTVDSEHLVPTAPSSPKSQTVGPKQVPEPGESQDAPSCPHKKVRFQLAEDQKKDFMELNPCKEFSLAQILGCFFFFLNGFYGFTMRFSWFFKWFLMGLSCVFPGSSAPREFGRWFFLLRWSTECRSKTS